MCVKFKQNRKSALDIAMKPKLKANKEIDISVIYLSLCCFSANKIYGKFCFQEQMYI